MKSVVSGFEWEAVDDADDGWIDINKVRRLAKERPRLFYRRKPRAKILLSMFGRDKLDRARAYKAKRKKFFSRRPKTKPRDTINLVVSPVGGFPTNLAILKAIEYAKISAVITPQPSIRSSPSGDGEHLLSPDELEEKLLNEKYDSLMETFVKLTALVEAKQKKLEEANNVIRDFALFIRTQN
jgi:hypothetical protein